MERQRGPVYRSLFWPIVFIGVGLVWLLANLEILPAPSVQLLIRLWPLALIGIGLDLLFARRAPVIGALIGLGVVGLVIVVIFLAPSLEFGPSMELKTLNFSEPLERAESARIDLDLERYPTTVEALSGSDLLIVAEVDTFTDAVFSARGDRLKTVSLRSTDEISLELLADLTLPREARWEIGLSPEIPLDLLVDVGSGSTDLDLAGLELIDLEVDGGSGSIDLLIPAGSSSYDVVVNGGSGRCDIEVEAGADLEATFDVGSGSFGIAIGAGVDMALDIEGGSGSVRIEVPDDLGVRLVVRDRGSGGVSVPSGFTLVDDRGDNDRDTGIWESANYETASHRVEITFDPGSGSFSLR